jgi:hypothetical protein
MIARTIYLTIISLITLSTSLMAIPVGINSPSRSVSAYKHYTINLDQPTAADAVFLAQSMHRGDDLTVDIADSQAVIVITYEGRRKPTDVPATLYPQNSTLAIGKILLRMLGTPQLDPWARQNILMAAKTYVQGTNKELIKDWKARKLITEESREDMIAVRHHLDVAVLASDNGISEEVLERNPELQQFLSANQIGAWVKLLENQHPIKVESDRIFVRIDGDPKDWNAAKDILMPAATTEDYQLKDHIFVEQGLLTANTSTVHPLRKIANPEAKYYYEENKDLKTYHRWIRIIDAEGNVYSMGWPEMDHQATWRDFARTYVFGPWGLEKDVTIPPDAAELTPTDKIQTTRYEITQAQYDHVMWDFPRLTRHRQKPSKQWAVDQMGCADIWAADKIFQRTREMLSSKGELKQL